MNNKQILIKQIFSISLLLIGINYSAAKTLDTVENLVITSDKQYTSLKENTVSFEGNVTVNQGSIKIIADSLIVQRSVINNKKEEKIVAKGAPVVLTQTLDDGNIMSAEAREMHYDVKKRLLTLTGKAKIIQSGSFVSNDNITYDMSKDIISAGNNQQGEGDSRVITIIEPQQE